MSSSSKAPPTKLELIKVRRSLAVAKSVYKILEDKREVLLKRIDEMIDKAGDARAQMAEPLSEAYRSLLNSYLSLGSNTVESIAHTTPEQIDLDINVRVVVDVKVPTMAISEKNVGMTYGFNETNAKLDETTHIIRESLPKILSAAESENAILSLAKELEKTQRLINALEYVIMPNYEESMKLISAVLEEREREDFTRLKHVKKVLERKRLEE